MRDYKKSKLIAITLMFSLSAKVAISAPVMWTDWQSTGSQTVTGTLSAGGTLVGVTYEGDYSFAQTSGGTNYWTEGTPAPYTGSPLIDNAPPDSDIIALSKGGQKTVRFSHAVKDPLIALVSWNQNTVDFGVPIEVVSFGKGYWGGGSPTVNASGTGFFGASELHGVIKLPGIFTSFTFTDTSENWHGFTVGVVGLATHQVPEPSSWLLLMLGLLPASIRRLKQSVKGQLA